jgi:hypothetical protein
MARAGNVSRVRIMGGAGKMAGRERGGPGTCREVRIMGGAGNTYLARNTGGLRSAKAARPSAASSVAKQTVWSWRS